MSSYSIRSLSPPSLFKVVFVVVFLRPLFPASSWKGCSSRKGSFALEGWSMDLARVPGSHGFLTTQYFHRMVIYTVSAVVDENRDRGVSGTERFSPG